MKWNEYVEYFSSVLSGEIKTQPYDDPHYFEYTKLNNARQNRWLKTDQLSEKTKEVLNAITEQQNWELITEPWCGDAAHIVPVIYQMSCVNPLVNLNIQLRDAGSEIDSYLTNGTKSIPVLIIRDANKKDLAVWGPRPKVLSGIFAGLKEKGTDFEEMKIVLQNWYNADKTNEIQKEVCEVLKK